MNKENLIIATGALVFSILLTFGLVYMAAIVMGY